MIDYYRNFNLNTKLYTLLTLFGIVLLLVNPISDAKSGKFNITISKQDITIIYQETELIFITLSKKPDQTVNLTFTPEHPDLIQLLPTSFLFTNDSKKNNTLCIFGKKPGHVNVKTEITPNILDTTHLFLRITIANSNILIYISLIVGWIYFLAWSVSFYPQIYTNFKRKSVVGLNFDFLALNIVGFFLYGLFNMGLYWNKYIEEEYFQRYPMGLNPVFLNDVVFSLHAMLATLVTICQCFFYEREDQKVSKVAQGLLGTFIILVIIFASLAGFNVIHWLDFLYYCSYIKLTITLIKYIPQAVMNYRRKSTSGWSIGNILLDFTGGILSMLQMILNAYNFDDWESIFGDPTKFGLGLFSVLFDIFFMIQHYILYPGNEPYSALPGNTIEEQPEEGYGSASEET